jgi:hemolysin III
VAAAGVALKLTGLTAERDPGAWAFAVLGWLPLLSLPILAQHLGPAPAVLLAATTVVYTVGAICFRRKRPDPIPTVFGYHEVWHVFTLVAGTLQFFLTIGLLTQTAPA